jgi:hypothetical protein
MMLLLPEYEGALYEGARMAGYEGQEAKFARILERAMWNGDLDQLSELAGCGCCCHEHTFEQCPARVWNGCRGSGSMTVDEEQSWLDHYQQHHGMTEERFFGYP